MSYKQKKQQRSKGKKHKKAPQKNTKYALKKMRKQKKRNNYSTSNKKNKKKKQNTNEPTAPNYQLSLSPFYSFSNHWSYLTRQYLCLSTWGTCMGGINEQYDDLLDQEASGPLVEENYKQALAKWRQEKAKHEKYNRENANKYERIADEKLNEAYNATNEYNRYNVYNYPNYNKTVNNNYYAAPPPKAYNQPPVLPPQPRQIPMQSQTQTNIAYQEQHRCPEYTYKPTVTEINRNIQKEKRESAISDTYQDTQNNYIPAAELKYDKAENNEFVNNYSIGVEETETYGNEMETEPEPELIKKEYNDMDYLSTHIKKPGVHITGGQSFGRRLNMFDEAATIKRRNTMERKEWTKQHHSGKDEDGDAEYRPYDNNGVQYIEQFTFHPAAVAIQPRAPRRVSTKEYSKFMKQQEEPHAIIMDDEVANLPASEKIKLFSRMSAAVDDE